MNFKLAIDVLANHTLDKADEPSPCDKDDLLNVTLIFQHVVSNLMWDHHNELGLTIEQRVAICEEFGNNIRQSILLTTGIDTMDAAQHYGWPDVLDKV